MHAAIDNVHHRHRQGAGEDAADIAVERLIELGRRRLRAGEADAEHRIGAEPALIGGAVKLDQRAVDRELIGGLEAGERIEDLTVDRADRLLHAAAAITLAAVAFLDRLMRPGRGARRHRRAPDRAAIHRDLDLDRRVAAAVEDLAGMNIGDRAHRGLATKKAVVPAKPGPPFSR